MDNREKEGKKWKDIRVIDGLEICDWLNLYPTVNIRAQELLGFNVRGAESLESAWEEWSNACNPPLSKLMFRNDVVKYKEKVLEWLNNADSHFFTIKADSRLEGLAFIHSLTEEEEFSKLAAKFVFVYDACVADTIQKHKGIIPIYESIEVGKKFSATENGLHTIHIVPTNFPDFNQEEDNYVRLSLMTGSQMMQFLTERSSDWRKIAEESGGSRTIARRLLAKNPNVNQPPWLLNKEFDKHLLIPLLFSGGIWLTENKQSRDIIGNFLGNKSIENYKNQLIRLSGIFDSPIWVEKNTGVLHGCMIGLYAIRDIFRLMALSQCISGEDIERFTNVFINTLKINDLDYYDYSSYKEGIYNTAIVLIIYKNLWLSELNDNIEKFSNIVKLTLSKLSPENFFKTNGKCCHFIAEAWPDEYLNYINRIIFNDINKERLLKGLPKTVHESLKEGLELLAVNSEYFEEATIALSKIFLLTGNEIYLNSLRRLFFGKYARTNATHEERIHLLRQEKLPSNIILEICKTGIFDNKSIGLPYYCFRCRQGEWQLSECDIPNELVSKYEDDLRSIYLNTVQLNESELTEILHHILVFSDEQRERIWKVLKIEYHKFDKETRVRYWNLIQDSIGTIKRLKNKNERAFKFICEARDYAKMIKPKGIYTFLGIFFSYSYERRFLIDSVGKKLEARLTKWRTIFIYRLPQRDVCTLSKILGEGEDINYGALASAISKSFKSKEVVDCIREIIVKKEKKLVDLTRCILYTYKGDEYISLLTTLRELLSKENFLELMLMDGWREEKVEMLRSLSPEDKETFWGKITTNMILRFSPSDEILLSHMYEAGRFNDIIEIAADYIMYFEIPEKAKEIILNSLISLCDSLGQEEIPSSIVNKRVIHILNYFIKHNISHEFYEIESKLLLYLSTEDYCFPEIKKHLLQNPAELVEWPSKKPVSEREFSICQKMLRIILGPPNIFELVSDGQEILKLITSIKTSGALDSSHKRGAFIRLIAGFLARTERKEILLGIGEIMEQLINSGNFKKNFLAGVLSDAYGTSNRGLFSTEAYERRAIKRLNNMAIELKTNCPLTSRLLSEASLSLKNHIQWFDDMKRLEERKREY